ncbi:MAG: AAA family ATPase [Candidatus Magasanikbacteria bacterium]|nr:AAA family ATPase [Candidatus Magasanikbacteria bacterium]
MPKLVVLCGHVGCGKTTLRKSVVEKNPQIVSADVYKYIEKYKDQAGRVSDENSRKAYEEMYQDLALHDKDTILEIGVKNSEFNFQNFNSLKDKFEVKVIFCLLDKEVCRQRVIDRGNKDKSRFINPDSVEEKFKIPFPDEHLKLAQDLQISFVDLDMSQPQEDLYLAVAKLF